MLVVSKHAGVHFVPAMVAMYQKEAAYHTIDSGADHVLQRHAHILKGIAVYNGKAIFLWPGEICLGAFPAFYWQAKSLGPHPPKNNARILPYSTHTRLGILYLPA